MENVKFNQVLDSKVYVKDNSAVRYPSARELLEPFMSRMGDMWGEDKVVVKTGNAVINADEGEEGGLNVAYPRVNVEINLMNDLVIPEANETFTSVLGFIYALDLQKPVVKAYDGYNASACLNLCVFNADSVFQQELLGNYHEVYDKVESYMDRQIRKAVDFRETITRLAGIELDRLQIDNTLGMMLRKSHNSSILGVEHIVRASKLLNDPKSKYAIGENGKSTKWNIVNAVTQTITDNKNIVARPDKTLAVAKFMEV